MPKTNSITMCAVVVGLSGASYWGILSSYLFYTAENTIIISMIIGFIISFIAVKIFLALFNKDTSKTIVGKFKKIYGKFSIVINILYIIISFSIYLFLVYRLTAFLASQYLIETPKYYMHLLILVTTFYKVSKGIETMARVSTISLVLEIIIFLSISFSLLKYVDFNNYLPVFTVGTGDIIKSSLVFAAYFSIPTFYINCISKDQIVDKDKFNKTFYFMYALSFLILITAASTTLGVFGIKLTNLFDYPLYTVLKKISLLSFIDSVENVSVILWILYSINASTIILYSAISAAKEAFNINKDKILSGIFFVLAFLIPRVLLMRNNYVEHFEYVTIPLVVGLSLLFLAFITLILSKKKM